MQTHIFYKKNAIQSCPFLYLQLFCPNQLGLNQTQAN